jgi:acyl-CoA thioester hydrolase
MTDDRSAEAAGPHRLEHTERWPVRTYELDSNGHVNNAVYLNYAEQIAADHAEALGLGREWTDRHQVAWAVREHQITYHRAATYRDVLRLTTRVGEMGGVRATRHTTIRRDADGELLAEITTQWVCVRLSDQRPTRIPADLLERFGADLAAESHDEG